MRYNKNMALLLLKYAISDSDDLGTLITNVWRTALEAILLLVVDVKEEKKFSFFPSPPARSFSWFEIVA